MSLLVPDPRPLLGRNTNLCGGENDDDDHHHDHDHDHDDDNNNNTAVARSVCF